MHLLGILLLILVMVLLVRLIDHRNWAVRVELYDNLATTEAPVETFYHEAHADVVKQAASTIVQLSQNFI